jgi:peptide methionine sulfoxide reductase MsrA
MELQNELKLPPCRGCFCVQKCFLELDGVTKVVSGYIEETVNPTYKEICNGDTCRSYRNYF